MTASQSLKIYEVLDKYFKDANDAKTVVAEIERIIDSRIEDRKSVLLTKDDKVDLIDRINRAKMETIIWIVSIGVLQFILSILAKHFL